MLHEVVFEDVAQAVKECCSDRQLLASPSDVVVHCSQYSQSEIHSIVSASNFCDSSQDVWNY